MLKSESKKYKTIVGWMRECPITYGADSMFKKANNLDDVFHALPLVVYSDSMNKENYEKADDDYFINSGDTGK